MAQKGINLGGWLVLERWMTPSLFRNSDALDEFSLSSEGTFYKSRITHHYQTFITEKDIAWLNKQGITILRVPIGYWIFGDEKPFISGIEYLDALFDWVKPYNMQIILSIHAAPGSQNGEHHSGKIGRIAWYRHRNQLGRFTARVVERYRDDPNFSGLSLLNEPHRSLKNIPKLIWHYTTIARKIRKISPRLPLYIDATFHPRLWIRIAKILCLGIDLHLYHGFDDADKTTAFRKLQDSRRLVRSTVPTIVGEWSGVIHHQPDSQTTTRYITEQRDIYAPTIAEFYWTYKTETGAPWSYRDLLKENTPLS